MNKAEKQYKQLLKSLRLLIVAHKDESEKGEFLRKKMDKLWLLIPEDQRKSINKNIKLPHVWYYADMIMHWRCEFCGKLEHEKPKDGLSTANIESVYPSE